MERIWQWVWDRYGVRWSWAVYAVTATLPLPIYLSWSFLIVAIEESSDYVEAATVTVVGVINAEDITVRGSDSGTLSERTGNCIDQVVGNYVKLITDGEASPRSNNKIAAGDIHRAGNADLIVAGSRGCIVQVQHEIGPGVKGEVACVQYRRATSASGTG